MVSEGPDNGGFLAGAKSEPTLYRLIGFQRVTVWTPLFRLGIRAFSGMMARRKRGQEPPADLVGNCRVDHSDALAMSGWDGRWLPK